MGSIFFILQLFTLIGSSSDSIIIAQYLGAASVAVYAVGFRLYQLLITPVQVVLEPSWPALNEALHAKDYAWVKKTVKRNFLFSLVASFFLAAFLIALGGIFIRIWIGKEVVLPFQVIVAFASPYFHRKYWWYIFYNLKYRGIFETATCANCAIECDRSHHEGTFSSSAADLGVILGDSNWICLVLPAAGVHSNKEKVICQLTADISRNRVPR